MATKGVCWEGSYEELNDLYKKGNLNAIAELFNKNIEYILYWATSNNPEEIRVASKSLQYGNSILDYFLQQNRSVLATDGNMNYLMGRLLGHIQLANSIIKSKEQTVGEPAQNEVSEKYQTVDLNTLVLYLQEHPRVYADNLCAVLGVDRKSLDSAVPELLQSSYIVVHKLGDLIFSLSKTGVQYAEQVRANTYGM